MSALPPKADIRQRGLDIPLCAKSRHCISGNRGNTLIRTTDYPCRAVLFCLVLSSSLAKPHPLANPNFFDCHDPADQPIPNARRPGLGWPRQWPRITAYSDGRGHTVAPKELGGPHTHGPLFRAPGTDNVLGAFPPTPRVSAAQVIGGKNDQRESTCDRRTARRWYFAGCGARSPDRRLPARIRRRGGQPCCTCSAWTTRTWRHSGRACTVGGHCAVKNPHGASHDQAPQQDVHVGKEPQRFQVDSG
jgi:hypothetical protein